MTLSDGLSRAQADTAIADSIAQAAIPVHTESERVRFMLGILRARVKVESTYDA